MRSATATATVTLCGSRSKSKSKSKSSKSKRDERLPLDHGIVTHMHIMPSKVTN